MKFFILLFVLGTLLTNFFFFFFFFFLQIFVEFEAVESSKLAQQSLAGRKFAGRTVVTSYVNIEKFNNRDFS